jgi:carbamoyltransferase
MGEGNGKVLWARWGPKRPRLATLGSGLSRWALDPIYTRLGFPQLSSSSGRAALAAVRQVLAEEQEVYVLGVGAGVHNAGAALVRVSAQGAVELVCNEEEERYTGIKHCTSYPEHSIAAIARRMGELGIGVEKLAACVGTWDYVGAVEMLMLRPVLEEAPASLLLLVRSPPEEVLSSDPRDLLLAPRRLARRLGSPRRMRMLRVRHHDAHAYASYGLSPFASDAEPTMVLVIDGSGDDSSVSLYRGQSGQLQLLDKQGSMMDSIGTMYGMLSSTQGGWPMLSSEGRYMGAAAWGDGNRLTNRYYRQLKHLLHLGPDGQVRVNRELANWPKAGFAKPYSSELARILGEPIALRDMWNPDAVLRVEDVRHPEMTRERVDKAAAVQMVFEDALVHMVEHQIRTTGASRLVLTGGAALNCVANMRLLECFDERWYERNLGVSDTSLALWVPPIPGDAGTPVGAAYAFAMQAGAKPGAALRHAFYCGLAPTGAEIAAALKAEPAVGSIALGDCSDPAVRSRVADMLACAVAGDLIVGLYQGSAETGPRALGHRSILANPCNPDTRRLLNERVKHRELIRPLAPMLTRAAAERLFHLHEGAAAADYNAYNYMVLTAYARREAHKAIPSVIHHDGTGRLQIVRPDVDPFCHEYLLAMGRRVGVEASVNTSLNVGAPIAQTPEQALSTLKRAHGMDGLLLIGREGQATLAWLEDRDGGRQRLMERIGEWTRETGSALAVPA